MPIAPFLGGRIRLSDIIVADRQREDLGDLSDLKASIKDHGLLSPIILDRTTKRLIAGGRRLAAFASLHAEDPIGGWDTIPFRNYDPKEDGDLGIVEYQENLARKDLTWQERVTAVAKLVEYFRKTLGLTEPAIAAKIAEPVHSISRCMCIWDEMQKGNEIVFAQETITAAHNAAKRSQARETDSLVADLVSASILSRVNEKERAALKGISYEPIPPPVLLKPMEGRATTPFFDAPLPPGMRALLNAPLNPPPEDLVEICKETEANTPILCGDFNLWAKTYRDLPFNFLHCDFPYGINFGESTGGYATKGRKKYRDDGTVWLQLCETLRANYDRLVSPSAHILFWFPMQRYTETLAFLSSLPDTTVEPFPLIWVRDKGVLPRPQHGPRRCYETAFFASRGDRMVVSAVSNTSSVQAVQKDLHPSTKPVEMLAHFFRMIVDKNTTILDPTCGSGSSLRAARMLGANTLVGIERDEEFAKTARDLWLLAPEGLKPPKNWRDEARERAAQPS